MNGGAGSSGDFGEAPEEVLDVGSELFILGMLKTPRYVACIDFEASTMEEPSIVKTHGRSSCKVLCAGRAVLVHKYIGVVSTVG